MRQSFCFEFERDNGPNEAPTPISVEYTVTSWGCDAQTYGPAENCYPAESIEFEIDAVITAFGPFVLRDSEMELVEHDAYGRYNDLGYDDYET